MVKAATAVNADPDATLWWVKEIRAVGPDAEAGQKSLLHVDLAVDPWPRLDDPAEQRKAEQRLRAFAHSAVAGRVVGILERWSPIKLA